MDAAADDQPVEHPGTLPEIVPAVKPRYRHVSLLESARPISSLLISGCFRFGVGCLYRRREEMSGSQEERPDSRRLHRRYRVADLQGTLKFAHPATVLDLSRSGAAVETAQRLVPGRSYPLQLESSDGLTVTTLGRVVWCTQAGTQEVEAGAEMPIYRAGLEFEKGLPDEATRLLDRLDEVLFDGIDTRMSARYKVTEDASTVLVGERATVEVRTLSRSGIGTEMVYCPPVGTMIDLVLPLDEPVEVRGRVAAVSRATEDPMRFLVGVEFVDLAAATQRQIDGYIERLRGTSPSAGSG
jgi:hypothetical protein